MAWDAALIAEGHRLVRERLAAAAAGAAPGRYQILAAINAVHTSARDIRDTDYHAYHATRADLLRRLGRSQQSRAAYDRAIALAGNIAETAYLTRRRDQLR